MPVTLSKIQNTFSVYTSRLTWWPGLKLLCLVIGTGIFQPLSAETRHVGASQTYSSLTQAVAVTIPGDTIMIHEGSYPGGLSFMNLQGTAGSNNLWYHSQNSAWTGPDLPVKDVNCMIGKNPLFNNAVSDDFTLGESSPARGKGYIYAND